MWNGGGVMGCAVSCASSLFLVFSSFSFFVGGVRGSARAALRARTLSPNTIAFSLVVLFSVLFFSCPRLSSRPAFLLLLNGGV